MTPEQVAEIQKNKAVDSLVDAGGRPGWYTKSRKGNFSLQIWHFGSARVILQLWDDGRAFFYPEHSGHVSWEATERWLKSIGERTNNVS